MANCAHKLLIFSPNLLIISFINHTRQEVKSVKEPVGIEEYSGNGERILIVDNVEAQRDISINLLEKLDYNVKAVVSGEEALEYMRNIILSS